jgi:hypothetical protein
MPLPRHTGVAPEHVVWVCQVPVLSQIWTMLPWHRVLPATQVPEQTFM